MLTGVAFSKMQNKILSSLVTCGYWRRHHYKHPLDPLVNIIREYGDVPEKFATGGKDLMIDGEGLHVEFPSTVDILTRSIFNNAAQTVYLNLVFEPNFVGAVKWDMQFAWSQMLHGYNNRSCFIGMTNNTSFGDKSPADSDVNWSSDDMYCGYEFKPRHFLHYDPSDLNCGNRFDLRAFDIFDSEQRQYRWNNIGLVYLNDSSDDDESNYYFPNFNSYESDKDPFTIFGELSFEFYRQFSFKWNSHYYVTKLSISEFPNKLENNEINNSLRHAPWDYQSLQNKENMCLAISIPHGSLFALRKFVVDDVNMKYRFMK